MAENIFNLTAPMRYRCHVHHYHSRLSRLYLRVFEDQAQIPAFYLLFSDVGYVEGPINWQGADIAIAPHQDCIDLMLATGMIGPAVLQFPDAYAAITDSARLYVITTTKTPVKVIGSSAARLATLPEAIN